ncbi:MAG: winged helix-turn-helix domain-containing protein [Bacteroidia bacterium]|nr:winged helix-turn-helix domain-containing protein [Bacteroidia bacterium]NNF29951.1 winged helix-turn-helix transcriptional regulator [Flavobacteriaceae bacterium]MBT8276069.1 winged helix-turn-helix domain-containing protein [Bacteroidia bacterium]NNJ81356.1 winged helix-turn-helix transcriptional regulator [Flavobacteriaceae bacterium]NNK53656.1 winged helix-turn-helix transcriptional regulator [Flavobacteriaceae bacterium]
MLRIRYIIYALLITLLLYAYGSAVSKVEKQEFSETVKVALRAAGNEVLLSNNDSTSVIQPVVELESQKYRMSFESDLSFRPGELVTAVSKNFLIASLPDTYRVEVIQCGDGEVAYSFQMDFLEESTIVACQGRKVPKSCYTIDVKFLNARTPFLGRQTLMYLILVLVLGIFFIEFFLRKRAQRTAALNDTNYAAVGKFHFYPEQNKLVKEAVEIPLSKKECELLAIFAASPNQVVKREELTKKVWEDNGVVVGRSLDTYISKLRKKLQEDDSIKLTNIHGVGYKLEVG